MRESDSKNLWGIAGMFAVVFIMITFPEFWKWAFTIPAATLLIIISARFLCYVPRPAYYRPRWNSRRNTPHMSRLSLVIVSLLLILFAAVMAMTALRISLGIMRPVLFGLMLACLLMQFCDRRLGK